MRNDLLVGVPSRSRETDNVGARVEVDDLGEFEVGGGLASEGEDEEGEEEGTEEHESEEGRDDPVQFVHESGEREDEDEEGDCIGKEDVTWELIEKPPVFRHHEYDKECELGGDRHNHSDHFRGVEV